MNLFKVMKLLFLYWIFAKAHKAESRAKGRNTLVLLFVFMLLMVPLLLINGLKKDSISIASHYTSDDENESSDRR